MFEYGTAQTWPRLIGLFATMLVEDAHLRFREEINASTKQSFPSLKQRFGVASLFSMSVCLHVGFITVPTEEGCDANLERAKAFLAASRFEERQRASSVERWSRGGEPFRRCRTSNVFIPFTFWNSCFVDSNISIYIRLICIKSKGMV